MYISYSDESTKLFLIDKSVKFRGVWRDMIFRILVYVSKNYFILKKTVLENNWTRNVETGIHIHRAANVNHTDKQYSMAVSTKCQYYF